MKVKTDVLVLSPLNVKEKYFPTSGRELEAGNRLKFKTNLNSQFCI